MLFRSAEEKLEKPKIPEDFMRFWLHRFRKLDVTKESHRQMLIDTFINAVFVYDDKLLLTFNFKDGTRTITLTDAKIAEEKNTGSNLDCSSAPKIRAPLWGALIFGIRCGTRKGGTSAHTGAKSVRWTLFSPWESPMNIRAQSVRL